MTTKTLLARLRDSSILADWQVNELKRFGDTHTLGRQLLQRGWLTPFQVNQALNGQWDSLVVGPYVLQERLGQGGMGQVFKAWHLYLARLAAVKILRKERSQDPGTVSRFRREVLAVAQLSHPNIVLAFDADEANGALYLAMEYVEGTTLSRLVRQRGPLPIFEACDYVRQAACGLAHAAERGLVHRDIKPSNLLVTTPLSDGSRTLKILDLGLAHMDELPVGDSATLTLPGMIIGTPDYIAPEQAVDPRLTDVRSDLYSLGCTLYFLVTGSVPFPDGSALDKVVAHRDRDPKPAEALRPGLARPVAALLHRLMAKNPKKRPAGPAELVAELDSLLAGGQDTLIDSSPTRIFSFSSTFSAPTVSLSLPRWRGWRDWRLLASVIALLVITMGGLLLGGWTSSAIPAAPEPARTVPVAPTLDGTWYYLGPFDFHRDKGYNDLAPLGRTIDLHRNYPGKGGAKVEWKELPRFQPGDRVDLRLFKQNEAASVFLYTRLDAAHAMSLPISLGSDDTLAVWLNGDLLFANPQQRAAAPDQNRVVLPLRAGKNDLLLKVGNINGPWAFYIKALAQ